jgi:hypothetical protein
VVERRLLFRRWRRAFFALLRETSALVAQLTGFVSRRLRFDLGLRGIHNLGRFARFVQ